MMPLHQVNYADSLPSVDLRVGSEKMLYWLYGETGFAASGLCFGFCKQMAGRFSLFCEDSYIQKSSV